MRQNCAASCEFCAIEDQVCDAESKTCMAESSNPIRQVDKPMTFTWWHKLESGPMTVEWISPSDEAVLLGTLEPGSSHVVNTFPDHVFRLRDAGTERVILTIRMFPGHDSMLVEQPFLDMIADCEDRPAENWSGSCAAQAEQGECLRNPGFMTVFCSASCHACHLRAREQRCTRQNLDMGQRPILQPGDMDALFEGFESRWSEYNATVLHRSPWIVTFDNFLKDDEIEGLLGQVEGKYERSSDLGVADKFGDNAKIISDVRTSNTAWCTADCETTPGPAAILERIVKIINVPLTNFESIQVLRYQTDEYYKQHHDGSDGDNDLPGGPRIYTFFLYLSDVEEGGETFFPKLNLTMKPRKGSALLWPSVLSDSPSSMDSLTSHAALPVTKGLKLAANTWVHLFNNRVPNRWGCTGPIR